MPQTTDSTVQHDAPDRQVGRRVLLLTPPYGDFTYPYHSTTYLAAGLKARDYEPCVVDLNAAWFRHVFTAEKIAAWRDELQERLARMEGRRCWDEEAQAEVIRILQGLSVSERIDCAHAVEIMTTEAFYDYDRYLSARRQIRDFEMLLNAVYGNIDFHGAFATPPAEPNAARLAAGARASPTFIDDLEAALRASIGDQSAFLFCGVSAPFNANLRPGLATFVALRRLFPGARQVFGGTAVTDIYKNRVSDTVLSAFAGLCDDLFVGEADHAIADYADWCSGLRDEPPAGTIELTTRATPPRRDDGPAALGLPTTRPPLDYSWIDWDLYLAPVRQINYSPTRGCFWNKCTFCDYGLNEDMPAAPYRKESADRLVEDLTEARRNGITHLYFAVDAIDPALLRRLCRMMGEERLTFRWSTELMLTRNFDDALAAELRDAGMVTASFGLETGSDRVAHAMGKGPDRENAVLRPVFAAFRAAGIGLQPKYFFGFPGETEEDRRATIDLLERYDEAFSVVTRPNVFELTRGAIVAKRPNAFGIADLQRRPDEDIGGFLDYRHTDGRPAAAPPDFADLAARIPFFEPFERPWVGGIDTLHSKLYLDRYGADIFKQLARRHAPAEEARRDWTQVRVTSNFDLGRVFDNVMVTQAAMYPCNRAAMAAEIGEDAIDESLESFRAPVEPAAEAATYTLSFR